MRTERISPVSFGIKPTLNETTTKQNTKLLLKVIDQFDKYNQKLDKTVSQKIRKDTFYDITEDKNGLEFRQGGFNEHTLFMDRKIADIFLKMPVKYIAKTLARAAEIFSLDDKMFNNTCNYINPIKTKKYPKIADGYEFENDIWKVYEKHIEPAIKDEFTKNKFLAVSDIRL